MAWQTRAAPILWTCSCATLWSPLLVFIMAGKEIPCPWQTWVAPSTSHLKAGLDIVIIHIWETSRLCSNRHTANLESLHCEPVFLVTHFMLCTNSITTSFISEIFFPSFWIWEISRCFSSAAIVTQPALSHFANLLDSSKFFISPSMLAFFDVMFTLNIQLWNTIRMRWDITLLQFRRHRNFHLFNYGIPFTAAALCAYCAYSFSLIENYWSFGSRSMM